MKTLNIIKNIILDIIIVILLLTIIVSALNRKKPTPLFGYYFFTVMSGSMQPALDVEDNIIVKQSDDYKIGDIITYKSTKSYVTHRIVKIDGNKIITKGDANTDEDPAFDKKNILGKVVFKSVYLNFLVRNRILILLIIILIYLAEMVFKTRREKVKESET